MIEIKRGKMHEMPFEAFFKAATSKRPRQWQTDLSAPSECANRLIRIPTGFGKTLGVLAVWLWHRVVRQDHAWPRRLVWCLPMRVLVEQTEREVRTALDQLDCLWRGGEHDGKVGVHLMMGGATDTQWHLHPEQEAVLIGTQDMLISRAMNRGYASPRARWPMEFGLLSQDTLWVMDEVQLMDVGLATSGQLQAFRAQDNEKGKFFRPCNTWWMSATLQPGWLKQSPDTRSLSHALETNTYRIGKSSRTGDLWENVSRPVETIRCVDSHELAAYVTEEHLHQRKEPNNKGPTLVVVNTVTRAVETWEALKSNKTLKANKPDLRLVHSRFRPIDRQQWTSEFLNREACTQPTNRIIVSTQVIEAGVDISTSLLITELAPWPSLVQRFGRCARWGGIGKVRVVDFDHDNDGKALPYSLDELSASRRALDGFSDVGPSHLESFEESDPELLRSLYPYNPKHLLLRHELEELFDTSPDLSGADIDISRFIRSDNERDVQVFWEEIDKDSQPYSSRKPGREELCSVPFMEAQKWLCGSGKSENLEKDKRAWIWDWLGREWRRAHRRDLYPGQIVLVEASVGGYSNEKGWNKSSKGKVQTASNSDKKPQEPRPCWKWNRTKSTWEPSKRMTRHTFPEDDADDAEDDESLSITGEWQTIAGHGLQAGLEADRIATLVCPDLQPLLNLAGRWHDLGKAHPAFQGCIQADDRPVRDDLAKAPDKAWPCSLHNMYRIDGHKQRKGFRHELASALGLFAVLQRHNPEHEALLGPWREWLEALDKKAPIQPNISEPTAVEREILNLNADEFDLLAYLVCSHHGKVRMAWHSSSSDQKAEGSDSCIRGVQSGDLLPPVKMSLVTGEICELPATYLDLSPSEIGLSTRTGRSWTERCLNLLKRYGPFSLAWLEALLRVADQRASKVRISDTLLVNSQSNEKGVEDVGIRVGRDGQEVAESSGGRAAETTSGSDSIPRGQFNGDGRGASGRELDSPTTRTPFAATRCIETRYGILTYQEMAPLLAKEVGEVEFEISKRKFAALSIESFLLEIHRRLCEDLLPDIAGCWRTCDVRVGNHVPPVYWRVRVLMREFAADVEARLGSPEEGGQQRALQDLAFAEGQFLHIHPFEDFNGRVARLFLFELMLRMDLPVVETASRSPEEKSGYLKALRAYDQNDSRPLQSIWERRFQKASL